MGVHLRRLLALAIAPLLLRLVFVADHCQPVSRSPETLTEGGLALRETDFRAYSQLLGGHNSGHNAKNAALFRLRDRL